MFNRIVKDESGIALVTAVVVSMVVLMLCTVVLQLSIHNVERSADDRRRVQSINAAEAGIDYYFSYLTETGGQAIQCSITKPMYGSTGSFTVTAQYYNGVGAPITCTPGSGIHPGETPAAVMLYSEGRSGTAAPLRKMQSYAKLTVTKGSTFDNASAIFADSAVNFTSNARIGGAQYSDADIYSNGNFTLAANSTIYGRLFSQGTVTIGSNSEVKKDILAKLGVTMAQRSKAGANVTSSQGSITLANPSTIQGDAYAQGSISGGTVVGSRNANRSGLQDPPTRPFPVFTYNQADWSSAGYTIAPTFSGATACTDAVNYVKSTWTSGSLLVRIAAPGSTCTTTFTPNAGNTPINVYGNLAIISDGPVELSTNARFVPSPSTGNYNVFVFAGLSGTAPCNFTARANSGFNPGLVTLIYTPAACTIDLLSNSSIAQGQLMGGTINFKHTFALNFQPVTIPGTGIGGFKQDVAYKREVRQL